jgi:hypothetical protein
MMNLLRCLLSIVKFFISGMAVIWVMALALFLPIKGAELIFGKWEVETNPILMPILYILMIGIFYGLMSLGERR